MTTARESAQLLTIPQVADRLVCSRGHVYNLIAAGAFDAIEIRATGTRAKTRIREADVDAFIETRTARSA